MTRRSPTTIAQEALGTAAASLELLVLCTSGPAREVSREVLHGVETALAALALQQARSRAKAARRQVDPVVIEGERPIPFE